MTRYSRADAEQVIRDAADTMAQLMATARQLRELADQRQDTGSEAARQHAELDRLFAWCAARQLRIDGLDPVRLALPGRLVTHDGAVDVWLSWQAGDDRVAWFYPADADVTVRAPIPPDVTV